MAGEPIPFNDPVVSRVLRLYHDAITEMCDDAMRRCPYSMLCALQYRNGLSEEEARKQVEEMFGAGCLSGVFHSDAEAAST